MFYLKGIPLYFRKLNNDDLTNSYYSLMSLLSDTNINMINMLSVDNLFKKLDNNDKIFVVVNDNTSTIVGTGTLQILNRNTHHCVSNIKEIIINKEYEKNKIIYTKFLKYLIDYSRNSLRCIKYTVDA
jgi:hypothetical protein